MATAKQAGAANLVGRTASELAAVVRSGEASPAEVLRAHLDHIERMDPKLNAFQVLRAEKALTEATALARRRRSFDRLPLAGVPVAIKDNIPIAGEPMRDGTPASPDGPRPEDHVVVARIRAAGGVIIGSTRVPELCIFGATDGAWGVTRNPWDTDRTTGGSSGGSAAAVASAMVPVAHGNDGMGSIRIPSACCGVVGLKTGHGVIPWGDQASEWFGQAQHGPLATTVADCALLASVMADRPEWATVEPPDHRLKFAVSVRTPTPGGMVDKEWKHAARETASLLARAGHTVRDANPPYRNRYLLPSVWRWFAGAEEDARDLDWSLLERRTVAHAKMGRRVMKRGWIKPEQRDAWRAALDGFFADHDVLLTPMLAQVPIRADEWGKRSWAANMYSNSRYAPFAAPWNFAGYPAMAVPAGVHSKGVPLSVQLVGPLGSEPLLLSVARQLEALRPWARHAPLAGV